MAEGGDPPFQLVEGIQHNLHPQEPLNDAVEAVENEPNLPVQSWDILYFLLYMITRIAIICGIPNILELAQRNGMTPWTIVAMFFIALSFVALFFSVCLFLCFDDIRVLTYSIIETFKYFAALWLGKGSMYLKESFHWPYAKCQKEILATLHVLYIPITNTVLFDKKSQKDITSFADAFKVEIKVVGNEDTWKSCIVQSRSYENLVKCGASTYCF